MTWRLLLLPALPLFGATILALTPRRWERYAAILPLTITAIVLAVVASLYDSVVGGAPAAVSLPWIPAAGLSFSFFFDGLSLLFALLISGVGWLVLVYAKAYLGEEEGLLRFYATLLLFMAAMLGIVCSSNLLALLVFWELTSISSFLLIGFRDDQAAARAGAYQALMVTGIGGLALLAGILMLGRATGTYEIPELLARAPELRASGALPAAFACFLLAAATKSAQAPFHFWLPNAMAAPTPVSAYLHSATMVKAGIFLLARMSPLFAATDGWFPALTGLGSLTMVVGGWGALRQTDLKGLLAYSTISQLGLIVFLLGCPGPTAAVAATLHILNHALFKAPLFMAAGIVDHEAGSRDLRRLGGLARSMPRTALVVLVAAAAMAGLPPLNGFVSKELFFEVTLDIGSQAAWSVALPGIALVAAILTVAYTLRFVRGAFFGDTGAASLHAHEAPAGLLLSPQILALACIVAGCLPGTLAGPLIDAAAGAVAATSVHSHLAVWHGWTWSLLMTAIALAGGGCLYVWTQRYANDPSPGRPRRSASDRYDLVVHAVLGGAHRFTDSVQNGDPRFYLRVLLVGVLVLGTNVVWGQPLAAGGRPATAVLPGAVATAALTCGSALGVALLHRRRLASVLVLAAAGMFVAIFFLWLSAPDLVLTQLLVETVSTLLIVLVLYFLPKPTAARETTSRLVFDASLSLIVGIAVAATVLVVIRSPLSSISSFHLAESWRAAGGRNVVNVILVDFRGYDTLGEISVLVIAALGVSALVRGGKKVS